MSLQARSKCHNGVCSMIFVVNVVRYKSRRNRSRVCGDKKKKKKYCTIIPRDMRRAIFSEHVVCCENLCIQDTAANPIITGRCGGNKIIMIVKRTTLSGAKDLLFLYFFTPFRLQSNVEIQFYIAIARIYRVRQWILTNCNISLRELNICGVK